MARNDDDILPEKKCPFCKSSERASLEEGILKGVVLKTTIARELGMHIEDVIFHIENHMHQFSPKRRTSDELKAKWASDKYDILFNSLAALTETFDGLSSKNDVGGADINAMVKLAGEIRKTVTDMSQLKGELQQEHHFTITMFNSLQELIVTELCPDCRAKVLKLLEKQDSIAEKLLTP